MQIYSMPRMATAFPPASYPADGGDFGRQLKFGRSFDLTIPWTTIPIYRTKHFKSRFSLDRDPSLI